MLMLFVVLFFSVSEDGSSSYYAWTQVRQMNVLGLNPLCPEFFIRNRKMYLQFITFLHTDITQVVEILSHVRQELTYSTHSILCVLMSWRRKEPGH